jgi:Kef-type K+ transport system membrane component KefB
MYSSSIVFSIFLIFTGAAVLATVALYSRQSLLVVYMLLGIVLGPWMLKWVSDSSEITQIGNIGIIFLLFLLGLDLHPQSLLHMLRKVTWIALISSLAFALVGYAIGYLLGFSMLECAIVGAAMMFSSTIIGLKLLPTTVLHHQHTGEIIISILLMQDIIAILVLLILNSLGNHHLGLTEVFTLFIGFPCLIVFAFLFERFILNKLLLRFDHVSEYIFLLAVGWCLGLAELAKVMGLSENIGAFIAGVAIAAGPIAAHIAESLKPLRDFFLVMFFFSIGASFNLDYLPFIWLPALILAALMLGLKPVIFRLLLVYSGEKNPIAWEVGVRLGQVSEFSLLVAFISTRYELIAKTPAYLIQAATILTFIVSSYWVVLKYPTPLAFTEKMRRD